MIPVFKYMLGESERVHDPVRIVRQKNMVETKCGGEGQQ
jgi:hypothetical protein